MQNNKCNISNKKKNIFHAISHFIMQAELCINLTFEFNRSENFRVYTFYAKFK